MDKSKWKIHSADHLEIGNFKYLRVCTYNETKLSHRSTGAHSKSKSINSENDTFATGINNDVEATEPTIIKKIVVLKETLVIANILFSELGKTAQISSIVSNEDIRRHSLALMSSIITSFHSWHPTGMTTHLLPKQEVRKLETNQSDPIIKEEFN